MRVLFLAVFLTFIFCLFPETRALGDGVEFGKSVESVLKRSGLKKNQIGIYISSPEGQQIFGLNEKKRFISASVMKLVTGLAVLEEWGPAFQFNTDLLIGAEEAGSTVEGPIYLRGGGDPTFISEKMWQLVNELVRDDILNINGGVVVDESRFDGQRFYEGRIPSEADRAFDAPLGALSFNWNSVNIFVKPGSIPGEPAKIVLDPENSYTSLSGSVKTVPGKGASIAAHLIKKKDVFGETVVLSGTIGSEREEKAVYRSIDDPDLWTGTNFVSFLHQRGIAVKGKVRRGVVPANAKLVRSVPGRPLRRVVDDMLKFSNNFVAEMLTKNLAAESGEKPATMKTGLKILQNSLLKWGVPASEIQVVSPSGLSRKNLLSARALGVVLHRADKDFKSGPEMLSGLPVGGVDGTLKRRFQGFERKVRAKTGLLSEVTALAGYVERPDGKTWRFSFLYNGPKSYWEVQRAFDEICHLLMRKNK